MSDRAYCAICGAPEHEPFEYAGMTFRACPLVPEDFMAKYSSVDDPAKALYPPKP